MMNAMDSYMAPWISRDCEDGIEQTKEFIQIFLERYGYKFSACKKQKHLLSSLRRQQTLN